MRLRSFVTFASVAVLFAACDSTRPRAAGSEPLGSTRQGLLALGQACTSDAQCSTATNDGAGHCVDTVCCNTACGGGARDGMACSNVYGAVAGLVPGQCTNLPNGAPCGALEVGGRCRFKASTVTNGACPAPGGGAQEQACYPCSSDASCPSGRPLCDGSGTQPQAQPIDTYFMLDHSGSMGNDCALGSGGTSKWCYATNALAKYFQAASTTGNRAALQYFTLPNSSCSTGSPHDVAAVGLTTLPVTSSSALIQNLAAAKPVNGYGTDIESAARGIVKFTTNNVTAGRTMTAVLITDGDPNGCNGNASQLGQILANHLNNTGIRTFVIGMNGATASRLEALAVGGGAPAHGPQFCMNGATSCHYYSVGNGDPAAFEAALGAIQTAVGAGCEACDGNNGSGSTFACPTTGAPICVNGGCVGCQTSADCVQYNPTTPVCNPTTNTCTQCGTNADCPATAPICTGGACVPCNGDYGDTNATHACPTPANPACILTGPGAGSCVPCTSTAQCPGDKPSCDPVSHTCGECTTNADCTGNTPICSAQRTCVPCDGPAGGGSANACPSQLPVCITSGPDNGKCVECTTASPGACAPGKVCDPTSNTCVECTVGSDCPSTVCDPSSHTCTAPCGQDSDCAAPKPVCNNGICVECTPTKPGACVAPKPVCNPATSTCVECTTSAQCPGAEPICNPTTHECTATCTLSSECPGTAPVCDPQTKTCVQCATNADCPSGELCDPSTHTCKPQADAGGPDAGNPDSGNGGGKDASAGSDSGPSPTIDDGNQSPIDEFSIQGSGCDCKIGPERRLSGDGPSAAFSALAAVIALRARRRRSSATK